MAMHNLWLLPLVVRRVGYYLNVLILILCHFVVEYEGVEFLSFCLLMVCLELQNVWLHQCQLLNYVNMVDIGQDVVK